MSEARPPYVRFEYRAVEDREASIETGSYQHKDIIFAIITPAGTKDQIEKEAEAWIQDLSYAVQQERFPSEWLQAYKKALEQWKENQEEATFGTSILQWPSLSPSQLRAVQAANIRTIEDLASCTDEALGRIGMGARALKSKAQAWVDNATGPGKVMEELAALRQANEDLRLRDEAREQEFTELRKTLEASQKPSK